MFNGNIHYKWPFSIAFCMFTRPGSHWLMGIMTINQWSYGYPWLAYFQTKPEIISSGSLAFQNTSPVAGIQCTRKVQGIMGILLECEWDIMRLTTVMYIYNHDIYIYILYLFIITTHIYICDYIYIYYNVGLCFLDGDYGYLTYFSGI